MSDFWDENPSVRRYWIEEDTGWLFRTSLVADERYSFGEHAWVPPGSLGHTVAMDNPPSGVERNQLCQTEN